MNFISSYAHPGYGSFRRSTANEDALFLGFSVLITDDEANGISMNMFKYCMQLHLAMIHESTNPGDEVDLWTHCPLGDRRAHLEEMGCMEEMEEMEIREIRTSAASATRMVI